MKIKELNEAYKTRPTNTFFIEVNNYTAFIFDKGTRKKIGYITINEFGKYLEGTFESEKNEQLKTHVNYSLKRRL